MTTTTVQIPEYGTVEWSAQSEIANDVFPALKPGERQLLKLKGQELEKTNLKPFLPFLGAKITNNDDTSPIRVIIGSLEQSGFTLKPKRSITFDGLPFSLLYIENIGTTPIQKGMIEITCVNDLDGILKYAEAVSRGLIRPFSYRA